MCRSTRKASRSGRKQGEVFFLAERPLGKLAKWLRLLGMDTLYEPEVKKGLPGEPDTERIRLTRTQKPHPLTPGERAVLIRSDQVQEQVRQVLKEAGLTRGDIRPFTRCIRCNRSIREVDKTQVIAQIPEYIWETHEAFSMCPSCGRVYWRGTHADRAGRIIEALFRSGSSPD